MTDSRTADDRAETPHVRIPPSFDAFYASEFPRMVDIAYALSGSRLAAEDLAQEAMIAAHRQWDRIGTLDRPGAWVRRVVLNKAASLYQRRKAEIRALARLGPIRGTLPAPLEAESAHVWREVRRLPARQSQAVVLFYLSELNIGEIAEAMGCSENTVKAHLHQARQKLAGRLDKGD